MTSNPPCPRIILGLLGGIASGKSTVSEILAASCDAQVIDADVLAKEALTTCAKDGRLASTLGPWALRPDGLPARRQIAERVFREPSLLRALERLTHPFVIARIDMAVDVHREGRGSPILVLDVPLLIEVGLDRRCDALWFVDAPDADRYPRAQERLGLTKDEVTLRELSQSPLDRKRARADLVIDNSGPREALEAQVRAGLAGLGVPGRAA